MQIWMKHMGSTAADLPLEYSIDEENKQVLVNADAFDSGLIESFLESVLKQRHGIDVIRDDRTQWHPPAPAYRVFLTMGGQKFRLTSHRLPLGENVTVVLRPV